MQYHRTFFVIIGMRTNSKKDIAAMPMITFILQPLLFILFYSSSAFLSKRSEVSKLYDIYPLECQFYCLSPTFEQYYQSFLQYFKQRLLSSIYDWINLFDLDFYSCSFIKNFKIFEIFQYLLHMTFAMKSQSRLNQGNSTLASS